MKNSDKIISKIIDEFVDYLLLNGASNINVNIQKDGERYQVLINSNYTENKANNFNKLVKELNSPKQKEVEEYYWELIGGTHCGDEFQLIGMMLDEAAVKIEDGDIEIKLLRCK